MRTFAAGCVASVLFEYLAEKRRGRLRTLSIGLNWPDVDVMSGLLHVRRSLTHLPDGDVLAEPKSSTSRRSVRLGPALVGRLTSHRAEEAETALRKGRSYDLAGLVSRRADGRRLSASMVLKGWQHAVTPAGQHEQAAAILGEVL